MWNWIIIGIGGFIMFLVIRPEKSEGPKEIIERIRGYFHKKV